MDKLNTLIARSISELPNVPAVYTMYGGQRRSLHVAYVGVAGKLKRRVTEHLVKHGSSVTTGASAVVLNPDYVTEIQWWEHPDFSERHVLEASELVAFEVFDPALRSRGKVSERAKRHYAKKRFHKKMVKLFSNEPTGKKGGQTYTFDKIGPN